MWLAVLLFPTSKPQVLSIGLRMLSLLEFGVRRCLESEKAKLAGLYGGNPRRATSRPTTERLLGAFQEIALMVVQEPHQTRYHLTPLSKVQQRILDRLEFHSTPKHGSWLNMAEIELSVLNRQRLDRCIPDKATLARETLAWETERNANVATSNWWFTTDDARGKFKRLYPSIQA